MKLLATILLAAICSTASAQSLQTNGKFAAPGTPRTLFTWVGSSTTQGTIGDMIGQSYTMPPDTLKNDGDSIEVYCLARATTTSLSKQLEVVIDGDVTATGASTNAARQWINFGRAWRTSSTNLSQYFERQRGDPAGSAGQSVDWDVTNSITFATASVVISCQIKGVTGATAAGDEDMNLVRMSVVYVPAVP